MRCQASLSCDGFWANVFALNPLRHRAIDHLLERKFRVRKFGQVFGRQLKINPSFPQAPDL